MTAYTPYGPQHINGAQCVSYVFCRIQEKLNIPAADPNYGRTFYSGDAKDMPRNYKNYMDGRTYKSDSTGKQYTIRVYQNDNGANIKKDSFVCFDGYGPATDLTSLGHVVYVEEVVKKDGETWVYYTDGGDWKHKNNLDGILIKKTLSDFLKTAYGGKYLAAICFEEYDPHTHQYNDGRGICSICGEYDINKDSASRNSKRDMTLAYYKAVKDGDAIKTAPYKGTGTVKTMSKGEEVLIEAKLTNSAGNEWYITDDGNYVYSENVRFSRFAVSLDALQVSFKGTDVIFKTTVHKPKGYLGETFGVLIYRYGQIAAPVTKSLPDPNGISLKGKTQYSLSVDLNKEAGIYLDEGARYLVSLFADDRNDMGSSSRYFSPSVKITGNGVSGGVLRIEADDSQLGSNFYDDSGNQQNSGNAESGTSGSQAQISPWIKSYPSCVVLGEDNVSINCRVDYCDYPDPSRWGAVIYDENKNEIGRSWRDDPEASGTVEGSIDDIFEAQQDMGIRLSPGTTYFYRLFVIAEGKTVWSGWRSFTTEGTYSGGGYTSYVCSFSPADDPEYASKEEIGSDHACLVTRIDKRSGTHVSRCGMRIFDAYGNQLSETFWAVDNVLDEDTYFFAWGWTGTDLTPDTLYQYSFIATVDGNDHTGPMRSFRTKQGESAGSGSEIIYVTFDYNNAGRNVTTKGVLNGYTWGVFAEDNISSDGTPNGYLIYNFNPQLPQEYDNPGYSFDGWYTAQEGGTRIVEGETINISSNIRLFAHWKPNSYPVYYDANGGQTDFTRGDYTYGSYLFARMPEAERSGYEFLGWFTEKDGGTEIKETTQLFYTPYLNLYAHWEDAGNKLYIPFTDVPKNAWYYGEVSKAYTAGLISGTSKTTFMPDKNLTMAEAIKLAACVYQRLNDGVVTLKDSTTGPWYMSYYDFLNEKGLLKDSKTMNYTDFSRYVKRWEMVKLFYDVIGYKNLKKINDVPFGSIPDVPADLTEGDKYHFFYWDKTYDFYRAGILAGSDSYGTFHPYSNIRRSEVAAILIRIIDPDSRVPAPSKLGQKK